MKRYEARLIVQIWNEKNHDWGESQAYQTETIENESEAYSVAKELDEDPDQAIRDVTADIFRGMDEEQDYSETNYFWTLKIIAIDDGGKETLLAFCGEWESKLAKEWFNN